MPRSNWKRPEEITDDKKWEEMNDNAVVDLYLAILDGILSSMNEKMTVTEIWERLRKIKYRAHREFYVVHQFMLHPRARW